MKILTPKIFLFFLFLSFYSCEQSTDSLEKPSGVFENLTQELIIPENVDTLLIGKNGSKIAIKGNSFVDKNGNPVSGNIQLSVKEMLSLESVLEENISTVTKNGILETRGMLKIEAFSNGEKIRLGEGKTIDVFFPKRAGEHKEMKLYYGEENDLGILEWKIADNEEDIIRTEKVSKRISVKHRLYNDLENKNTLLKNNSEAIQLLDSLITFTELEKQNLLGTSLRIHWLLFDDGDFEVLRIDGQVPAKKKEELKSNLNNIPYVIPFFREGIAYDMTGVIDIIFSENPNFNPDDDFYVLNATQLGWINCDIFIEFDAPKIDMLVKAPGNSTIKVLFKNYNTIVSGYEKEAGYEFSNIPQREAIEIIAINYVDPKKPMFSLTQTSVDSVVMVDPLQSISIDDLKFKLGELN